MNAPPFLIRFTLQHFLFEQGEQILLVGLVGLRRFLSKLLVIAYKGRQAQAFALRLEEHIKFHLTLRCRPTLDIVRDLAAPHAAQVA